jgi:hypothetical protein
VGTKHRTLEEHAGCFEDSNPTVHPSDRLSSFRVSSERERIYISYTLYHAALRIHSTFSLGTSTVNQMTRDGARHVANRNAKPCHVLWMIAWTTFGPTGHITETLTRVQGYSPFPRALDVKGNLPMWPFLSLLRSHTSRNSRHRPPSLQRLVPSLVSRVDSAPEHKPHAQSWFLCR